jgi:hypothetical protein
LVAARRVGSEPSGWPKVFCWSEKSRARSVSCDSAYLTASSSLAVAMPSAVGDWCVHCAAGGK